MVSFRLTPLEIFGRVVEQYDAPLVAVRCLVHHLDLERSQLIRRLFKHLGQVLHGHLKILLIVFEDLRQIVTSEIVGKGVSPLQRLSALLEGLRGRLKKLNFDPGHARRGLQLRHLLLRLEEDILVQFGRLLVIGVSVVVVKIPLQALARLGLSIPRIVPALLLVSIAIVPGCAVLTPDAHAHPAKLVLALSTSHVVASAVLLNRAVTSGALLRIG